MAINIGAIQRDHPQWNVVDAIAAPNGGIWAVGSDGGVFSLNAQGGTDGVVAPYHGSYTQLDPGQRQGNRSFVAIQADPATGGYTLISNQPGQTYNFKGDKPIDQGVDPNALGPATKGLDFTDADLNSLTTILKAHGLESLVDTAWGFYKNPQGGAGDADATLAFLETTPEFQTQFPGLKEMAAAGKAWTPGQWSAYYNSAQEAAVSAGLPPGMISRDDVGKLLAGNVSVPELTGRIQAAGASVYNADPVLIKQMRDFGMTDGDLTAFYLDPDKAAPLLERKAQEEQGRIGAAARRTGRYDITLGEAQGLQQMGVNETAATAGFGTLATEHALFQNLTGETGDITRAEQLGAQFGNDTAAQQEIERRRAARGAAFAGGGGAASGGQGAQGLGASGQ